MTHFCDTLQALMAVQSPPMTQQSLAVSTGISQATISRIIAGREPTRHQVGQLCAAISQDHEQRLQLLFGYLRDCAATAKMAGIDERHYVLEAASDQADDAVRISGSLGAEMQLIAEECANQSDIRGVVSDLAHMIMRHRAELADARAEILSFPTPREGMVAEDPPSKRP